VLLFVKKPRKGEKRPNKVVWKWAESSSGLDGGWPFREREYGKKPTTLEERERI